MKEAATKPVTPGQTAFEAFNGPGPRGGTSSWQNLPKAVKENWEAAARAVVSEAAGLMLSWGRR
ncbi:hypothetical protein [Caldimonas brevitalea]|uniref:Uncharacterized protein n=1 Tax=Caldimonas brevitalea TaxID=413882 RepID=A0A0G3BHI6_9BURK|nr:hypothetical protein [Caldimonas brevitalea]AKJ28797.1 hypothetical protein AAW51_2106 [Caldimonas brevitalea]